jgi:hypothetical protein
LPPLGFEPVNFEMLAHLSDHSAKSHLFYSEGVLQNKRWSLETYLEPASHCDYIKGVWGSDKKGWWVSGGGVINMLVQPIDYLVF